MCDPITASNVLDDAYSVDLPFEDRDLSESCLNNGDTKGSFIQQLMRRKYSKFLLYVATLGIKLYGHFGDLAKDVFLMAIIGRYLRYSSFFFKWVIKDTFLKTSF